VKKLIIYTFCVFTVFAIAALVVGGISLITRAASVSGDEYNNVKYTFMDQSFYVVKSKGMLIHQNLPSGVYEVTTTTTFDNNRWVRNRRIIKTLHFNKKYLFDSGDTLSTNEYNTNFKQEVLGIIKFKDKQYVAVFTYGNKITNGGPAEFSKLALHDIKFGAEMFNWEATKLLSINMLFKSHDEITYTRK